VSFFRTAVFLWQGRTPCTIESSRPTPSSRRRPQRARGFRAQRAEALRTGVERADDQLALNVSSVGPNALAGKRSIRSAT
jgi:hypothetical protein